jgi:hypothetical protein
MNNLARIRFPGRVLNACDFQIECMIVGQGQQVKAHGCQCIEGSGGREKTSAFADRFTFFGNCGFEIREHYVTL